MKLRKLTTRTLWRLSALEREAAPSGAALEVERIVFERTARSHLGEYGSAFLLLDSNDRVVGAALHYNHEELPYVQYVAALFVDPRFRGCGLGREAFVAVVEDARQRSGRPYAAWAVHPQNAAMLQLSRELTTEFGVDEQTGYVQFVYPYS
jgi:GNAT superfamily N-acetyltransferase